ncbi:MAG: YqcI/YcgG family protein [Ktedonobacteraceae bacterium]|nr:YqcI/YcgG family protein [Ktedonobacteraceae bacterium]
MSVDDMKNRILFRDAREESIQVPDWLPICFEIFRLNLMNKAYPCYFGTAAERQGELLLTYVDRDDYSHLPQTLSAFLSLSATHPKKRYIFAIFFQPDEHPYGHDHYQAKFWNLLQFLHENDPHPWPKQLPSDLFDPQWEFAFAGIPAFVFLAAPSYRMRRSRNLGPGMIVLYQPRRVFNEIEGGTPAGTEARRIIRSRLTAWDNMETHPDMGSYGDSSNYEWKQYVLADDNTPATDKCPLRIKSVTSPLGR